MTRKVIDGTLERYECERCDCVIALVDTSIAKPDLREGSFITGVPEPAEGCECDCHDVYRAVRRFPA